MNRSSASVSHDLVTRAGEAVAAVGLGPDHAAVLGDAIDKRAIKRQRLGPGLNCYGGTP